MKRNQITNLKIKYVDKNIYEYEEKKNVAQPKKKHDDSVNER